MTRATPDSRFRNFSGAIESIVTSTAQEDGGLFEVDLHDQRYLPFEGAGADSPWRLELPNDVPQFDFESISDVVLHLRYTAREARNLRAAAAEHVKTDILQAPTACSSCSASTTTSRGMERFRRRARRRVASPRARRQSDPLPVLGDPAGDGRCVVATFGVIDWTKHKLTIAPATVALAGDAVGGAPSPSTRPRPSSRSSRRTG